MQRCALVNAKAYSNRYSSINYHDNRILVNPYGHLLTLVARQTPFKWQSQEGRREGRVKDNTETDEQNFRGDAHREDGGLRFATEI